MLSRIIFLIIALVFLMLGTVIIIFKVIPGEDKKKIELTYTINAGIPFKWEYEIEDEEIVKCVGTHVIRNDNKHGKVGGKIATNYVFKGFKEGTTNVTFKFVSITGEDRGNGTVERHTLKVDKDLNISLVTEEKEH